MKLAIMQPYFIPYIGYWQLMNMVDQYIIFDDVNYINRGWINRNKILVDGKPKYINIPLLGASQNKKINEITVNNDEKLISKKLRTIEYAYKKAPFYQNAFPIIERILKYSNKSLVLYLEHSFYIICEYLNIKTKLYLSSSLNKNNNLKGEKRILDICQLLGATEYCNAIGGQRLYSFQSFRDKNIELKFLKSNNIVYRQLGTPFQNNLSIIDVMMFNSKNKIEEFLQEYTLIRNFIETFE